MPLIDVNMLALSEKREGNLRRDSLVQSEKTMSLVDVSM